MMNPDWKYQTSWTYTNKVWIASILDRNGNLLAVNNFVNMEDGQKWVEDRLEVIEAKQAKMTLKERYHHRYFD